MDYVLSDISEKETKDKAVFELTQDNVPFFKGKGSDNYLCGICKTIICENISKGQFIGLVFKCWNCKSFNKVRGT